MRAQEISRYAAAGIKWRNSLRPWDAPLQGLLAARARVFAKPTRKCDGSPPSVCARSNTSKLSSSLASHLSSLLLGLLLGAICLWSGCAAQGPPHPPRIQQPVRIGDLKVEQRGRTLRLTFSRPLLATDGRRLTKPIGLTIFRQLSPPGELTGSTFTGVRPWVSLPAGELGAHTEGPDIIYNDRLSAQNFRRLVGTTFSFRVESFTRGFRGRRRESDPSNIARMKLLDVSPPLQGIRAVSTPRGVNLRWSPPTQSLTGGRPLAIASYIVYRSTKPQPSSYALLGRTIATEYMDRNFRFNQTYFYRIRALFQEEGYVAENASSQPVSIVPRDIFPPPVPSGLTAVYTGRSVQLVWNSVVAPNLAGYNIYRQESSGLSQRLNHELLRTPTFADTTAEAGHRYSYWVTSVSLAHNESSPSAKAIVETQ
jgi:hypothetical protein